LYKRIIISLILCILIIIVSIGIASYITVKDTIDQSLDRRVALAKTIANHGDSILEQNFNRLYDISLSGGIDFNDGDWQPEKKALQTAYQYSIFTDGIFLLDLEGNTVLTYPSRIESSVNLLKIPYITRIIADGKPVISDIYTVDPIKKKVIFALTPLRNKDGEAVGIVGGEINPTNYMLSQVIRNIPIETDTHIEIVDSHGIIIASNNPERIFTGSDHNKFLENLIKNKEYVVKKCHRCHGASLPTDILAFAPLTTAPWGISILQPEEDVFAPARKLRKTFILFSIISIGVALMIAVGMSRSIIRPIHELINATRKIAAGNMKQSVSFGGVDEIGMLSSSFEIMRLKLADSLEELQQYNVELERRVSERTHALAEGQKKIKHLLEKVITAQEEESKRIARGLHDQTMQSLAAILMRLDMCMAQPEHTPGSKVMEIKEIALQTLDGVHNVIENLRPSTLDDLGLEAAIRWLLDRHLGQQNITYFLNVASLHGRRFDPYIEITLFRILQEAVINITRHGEAENVFIIFKIDDSILSVDIEDDGKGFDVPSALQRTEDGRGLGLLGMKERTALVNGSLDIYSRPGSGTRITLRIPIHLFGEENE
jgi:signal transduction histidine kinase